MEAIKKRSWQEVAKEVSSLNPQLSSIVNELNPGQDLSLVEVSYRYGDEIIKDGKFQLPMGAEKADYGLDYASIPMFLVMDKNVELYIDNSHIVPLNLLGPGSLLGLYETANFLLHKPLDSNWSVSAGVRSVFTLDKFNDTKGHLALSRRYKIPLQMESRLSLQDHWEIFRYIGSSEEVAWDAKILVFPQAWFQHVKDTLIAWVKFYQYIYAQAWASVNFALVRLNLDLKWRDVTKMLAKTKIKPSLFVADVIKHMMGIALGYFPAFRPQEDEQNAPISAIRRALLEVYQLRDYYPTIMHIAPLERHRGDYLYYSLSLPTSLSGVIEESAQKNIMVNLKTVRYVLEKIRASSGVQVFDNIDIRYFHVVQDIDQEVELSKAIHQLDPGFQNFSTEDYKFCHASQFWRGCIGLSFQ